MRILFIGDLYGRVGVDMLLESLPELKEKHRPNLTIVNGENAANGRGISKAIYKELMSAGVHAVTMGNWVFGRRDLLDYIDGSNIIRPLNFPDAPGRGYLVIDYNATRVMVVNVLGRTFMNPNMNSPFSVVDDLLAAVEADYTLIDIHAEATSEKVAFGHYFDGRVDCIVGTHTHVPTADNRRLPNGTIYMTDVGMTGPLDGVIGVKKEIVIERFTKGFSTKNEVASGPRQLNGILIDLENRTSERIHMESECL
ncbi:MAG: TIGR00282 family metallophosphoesterase [Acholeplasmataceae bacterium]